LLRPRPRASSRGTALPARPEAASSRPGTCVKARGIPDDRIAEGAFHSGLEELTDWTVWAEKVVAF